MSSTNRIRKFNEAADKTHEDDLLINGSGLFHFRSTVPRARMLEVVKWYDALSPKEREMVDILRAESNEMGQSSADSWGDENY